MRGNVVNSLDTVVLDEIEDEASHTGQQRTIHANNVQAVELPGFKCHGVWQRDFLTASLIMRCEIRQKIAQLRRLLTINTGEFNKSLYLYLEQKLR